MRSKTRWLGACALFLSCALLCSSLFYALDGRFGAARTQTGSAALPVIVLDAGHGGEDGGAVGVNGVLEKDLNLSLTRTLADLLRGAGYTVIETRTDDKLLYEEGTPKGKRKQQDLKNRVAVAARYPDSVFISIHMNTYPTPNCEGVQVWYAPDHAASLALAQAVQDKVSALLQPENHRKVKEATRGIYVLKHAVVPAVLVECGFLSTPRECEKLCDEEYRKALALAIFCAVGENLRADPCENGA